MIGGAGKDRESLDELVDEAFMDNDVEDGDPEQVVSAGRVPWLWDWETRFECAFPMLAPWSLQILVKLATSPGN